VGRVLDLIDKEGREVGVLRLNLEKFSTWDSLFQRRISAMPVM
jgi:hypothetical protein